VKIDENLIDNELTARVTQFSTEGTLEILFSEDMIIDA